MIKFIIRGILRDKSKSIIPIAVISVGVMVTVMMSGFLEGVFSDVINQNAKLDTGHVKIMTKPYAENKEQLPNDLALLGINELIDSLNLNYPDLIWTPRIKFGGIMDVPDASGNTKLQGPGIGLAISILSEESGELQRLQLNKSLKKGRLPKRSGEIILSDNYATKLNISPGEKITFFGSTMEGSMVFQSYEMTGTVEFGSPLMDKGTFIIDIRDAQNMLDMENGTGELLGYFKDDKYDDQKALVIAENFNAKFQESKDEYTPVMFTLKDQNGLRESLDVGDAFSGIFIFIFILAMSLVLWNTGLIGGLRRYNEFGIRLALGESKNNVFKLLLIEASVIGLIGSIIGTSLGLVFCYYLQEVGIDISKDVANSTIIMPSVMRAYVTSDLFYIGFIPGLFSMLFGTALAGRGIYKRETARLFKELEV
ncbi:FtsX-like permease family protein [Flavobacteriaceae bacterium]|jgi:putative ABC transport system permease protein|nr:FtsX-like permease family protein [Flavobacteriaceae bacterium]MDB4255286.1 FtsX-like permease family protein [Flavobacteriaceae bacterium]MDC1391781.1 FtsX-like permease family protein [Flavobacteriaceae bacterium]